MFTVAQVGPEFEELTARSHRLAEELLDGLKVADSNVLISKGEILTGPSAGSEKFFRLTDGNVPANFNGVLLFHYDPGELIGLENAFGVTNLESTLDFAVRLDIFDKEKTLKKIRKDAGRFEILMEYIAVQTALFQSLLSANLPGNRRPSFQVRTFDPGDVIIRQGATDQDVFSMINGTADVFVDETRVGRIGENEVFGEMARLTGEPRSATVSAHTRCEVMVFEGGDFDRIAESNPKALIEIARNLSNRLALLDREMAS